ncbi:hypothetical protein [Sediminitomix flava]|uniref:Uncharacterized protein n=1 Tax=Sediminitomix flava TaxID=379075 RepID=A0A316A0I6_SEDFL|nr:hypothetical protein [Sediminitomix flava]PWJ43157.1 hypothetical protein BC781_102706 [Sediminitomix flava]
MMNIYSKVLFGLLSLVFLSNCSKNKNEEVVYTYPLQGFYLLNPYVGAVELSRINEGTIEGIFTGIERQEISGFSAPNPLQFASEVSIDGPNVYFGNEQELINNEFHYDEMTNRLHYKITFRDSVYEGSSVNMTNGRGLMTCDHDVMMNYMDELIEDLENYYPIYFYKSKVDCIHVLSTFAASFENLAYLLEFTKTCYPPFVHPLLDALIIEFHVLRREFQEALDTIHMWWPSTNRESELQELSEKMKNVIHLWKYKEENSSEVLD